MVLKSGNITAKKQAPLVKTTRIVGHSFSASQQGCTSCLLPPVATTLQHLQDLSVSLLSTETQLDSANNTGSSPLPAGNIYSREPHYGWGTSSGPPAGKLCSKMVKATRPTGPSNCSYATLPICRRACMFAASKLGLRNSKTTSSLLGRLASHHHRLWRNDHQWLKD